MHAKYDTAKRHNRYQGLTNRIMTMHRSILPVSVLASVLLGACGASPKNVIVQEGATVEQIMRGEGGEVASSLQAKQPHVPVSRLAGTTAIGYSEYTRDSLNETKQLFPTLPNPTIVLYIHPHKVKDPNTGESLPVPGYATAFPLYNRVEFALPGELPSSRDPVSRPFPAANEQDQNVPYSDQLRPSIR